MNVYRTLFALAAIYNLAFAIWSGVFPRAFFQTLLAMEPPAEPVRWPVVAVVVGLFGLLYAYAAWRPERADIVVAVGLMSKIAGPLGWLVAVSQQQWPVRTFPLVLLGDLLWWFPLLAYLLRNTPLRAAQMMWLSAAVHLVACLGLLFVAPGAELGDLLAPRAGFTDTHAWRHAWVAAHRTQWVAVWMVWSVSSLSLLALFIVWAARLWRWRELQATAFAACLVVGCGVLLDLCGESTQIAWAARPELDDLGFLKATLWYQRLSPAAANGLYCCGGMLLSNLSWQIGLVRGGTGVLGMVLWTVGLALTAATMVSSSLGMIVSGAAVMLLYIPFAALLGWKFRRPAAPAR